MSGRNYPTTPDGRYFLVAGRLWRSTNPALDTTERERLVGELMQARRAVKDTKAGLGDLGTAREAVDRAKTELGERGPVWWTDGAPGFQPTSREEHALCVVGDDGQTPII